MSEQTNAPRTERTLREMISDDLTMIDIGRNMLHAILNLGGTRADAQSLWSNRGICDQYARVQMGLAKVVDCSLLEIARGAKRTEDAVRAVRQMDPSHDIEALMFVIRNLEVRTEVR